MTDAEELAVLREFADKAAANWHCLGDLYLGTTLQNNWIARRIGDSPLRAVSYGEGSILAEDKSLAKCILAARAKLAAERDAKDAPRLRELLEKWMRETSGCWMHPTAVKLRDETNAFLKGAADAG